MNVAEAEGRLGIALPEALRALYREGDGRHREDGQWWVVWRVDEVVERNLAAWSDGSLATELIAFGDDGTGNPFCVDATGRDPSVVHWSWIDRGIDGLIGPMATFVDLWLGGSSAAE